MNPSFPSGFLLPSLLLTPQLLLVVHIATNAHHWPLGEDYGFYFRAWKHQLLSGRKGEGKRQSPCSLPGLSQRKCITSISAPFSEFVCQERSNQAVVIFLVFVDSMCHPYLMLRGFLC